jgi:hypothetical protein
MSIFNQPQQQMHTPNPQSTTGLPPHAVVIYSCRLSYFNCYEPAPDLNNVMKYSVTLLISKSYNLSAIEAAVQVAVAKGIKDKWGGYRPPNLLMPVKDGDMYASMKPDKRQPYVGNYYISCNQNPEFGKPIVLNEHRMISTDKLEVQSGDYADVVVEFTPYNNKSVGISAIPKVIRKTMTGERFTQGVTEAEALAAVGGVMNAPPGFGDISSLF